MDLVQTFKFVKFVCCAFFSFVMERGVFDRFTRSWYMCRHAFNIGWLMGGGGCFEITCLYGQCFHFIGGGGGGGALYVLLDQCD